MNAKSRTIVVRGSHGEIISVQCAFTPLQGLVYLFTGEANDRCSSKHVFAHCDKGRMCVWAGTPGEVILVAGGSFSKLLDLGEEFTRLMARPQVGVYDGCCAA